MNLIKNNKPKNNKSKNNNKIDDEYIKLKENKIEKPKSRRKSPYIKFCEKTRPQLKLDNPGIPFGQIGILIGKMWNSLTNEQRQEYTH